MKDPYAPESETTALIKADTRTAAERELARLMADAGDGEQGFEPEVALQRIALSLIKQLQDARTEVVALHATEQNLRDGIAPQEDRASQPAQPAPSLLAFAQNFLNDYQTEDGMQSIKYYAREAQAAIDNATLSAAQPCPTCEALARTVMMDQTGRDA
jgi:hypothetical protein